MKKKSLLALVLVFSLILGLALTACGRSSGGSGGTKTLESVVASDSDLREGIEEAAAKEKGLEIKIEGNELIYVYDLLAIEGADEKDLKNDAVKAALEAGLDE